VSAKTKAPTWRSRIVGTGEEPPDQLVANPRNWRTHPGNQRDALRGSLDTVGWVQQVMVNRTTGHVVDGHARVEEAISRDEPTVPVLYVELTEAEEDFVLATLDPISALANADAERLAQLLADVSSDSPGIQQMLADLARDTGAIVPDFGPVGIDEQGRLDQKAPVICPECGHEFTP
jgi:ParB-like chromosome segregation protein Spo0J